jgi:hypothetical protein
MNTDRLDIALPDLLSRKLSREELDELRYGLAKAGFGFVRLAITHDQKITDECWHWINQRRRRSA